MNLMLYKMAKLIILHLDLMIKENFMAEEKYYDENKCPICNSQKITYCGSEIQNPYLFYRCICDKCNTTFDMYYELIYAGIENIIRGN